MILTTGRLRLRPFTHSDAPAISALAGDPRVARMLIDIPQPFPEAAARRWLRPMLGELRLGVEHAGTLIGGVCYFCHIGGAGSLGYWLGADHWGKGYASEAAGALVRHGFERERIQRFDSAHFEDNPASGRVLRRLGFAPCGQASVWCPARGQMVDVTNYTLTRGAAGFSPVPRSWAGLLGLRLLLGAEAPGARQPARGINAA